MTRGHFLMARGVRHGCPASGFLFAMAFDPIIRWLQDAIIPTNLAGLDFLQPAPCTYADDFAVAASSFRRLMTALALPSKKWTKSLGSIWIIGNAVGYNTALKSCQSLLDWVATNCEEFGQMQIAKHAKYVGTMVGPEGHIHPFDGTTKNSFNLSKKKK